MKYKAVKIPKDFFINFGARITKYGFERLQPNMMIQFPANDPAVQPKKGGSCSVSSSESAFSKRTGIKLHTKRLPDRSFIVYRSEKQYMGFSRAQK
jgi:hypothetical protein